MMNLFGEVDETLPAITLWQPFASLIFAWDRARGEFAKANETRGWPLPARLVGKRMVIHSAAKFPAAKHISAKLNDLCYDLFGCGYNYSLPLGKVIGTVVFREPIATDALAPFQCETELTTGDWSPERWAWPILEAVAFAEPIAAKGRQGLWRFDASGAERQSPKPGINPTSSPSSPVEGERPEGSI